MKNKIGQSEFFAVAAVMLYGAFSSSKIALTLGNAALPVTLFYAAVELAAIFLISVLPPLSKKASPFFALLSVPFAVLAFLDGTKKLLSSGFDYISYAAAILFASVFIVYAACKGLGTVGRLAILIMIFAFVFLSVFLVIYVRKFDFRRISCGFSDYTGAFRNLAFSLAPIYSLYLMKGYFYVPEKGRAAKKPLEANLGKKEKNIRYRKTLLSAWAISTLFSFAVTLCLLSLADSAVYAKSGNAAVFAARLLENVSITPLVAVMIYALTLFSVSATLSAAITVLSEG